jgi:hypothetical protein
LRWEVIDWDTQATRPEGRTKLTNAMISRDVMLACYEHAAAWRALARWHQEQAAEATRLALAVLAWGLAHPEVSPEMTVRELRRMVAVGTARRCAR